MNSILSPKIKYKNFSPFLIYTLLFLCTITIFYWTTTLPFFSDDFDVIWRISKYGYKVPNSYRYIGNISLFLDYNLYGINPSRFHLTNIILHGVAVCLVYATSKNILRIVRYNGNYEVASLLAALFFMVYPFSLESVIWIVGRGILFNEIFFLASLNLLIKYYLEKKIYNFIISLIFYFLATLSYETSFSLPLIGIFFLYVHKRPSVKTLIYVSGWFAVITLASFILKSQVNESKEFYTEYYQLHRSVFRFALNFLRLGGRSVFPPLSNTNVWYFFVDILWIVALWFFIIKGKKENGLWKVFVVFLLSLLTGVTIGIYITTFEGGRILYVPAIFLCIMLGGYLALLSSNRKHFFVALFATLTYLLFFTIWIFQTWEEAATKIENILNSKVEFEKKNVVFYLPHQNNGAYIFRNGYEQALKLNGKISDSSSVYLFNKPALVPDSLKDASFYRYNGQHIEKLNRQ